jgi:hypothetical protein
MHALNVHRDADRHRIGQRYPEPNGDRRSLRSAH